MTEKDQKTYENRRRFPRFRIPPKFKIRARIRIMGEKTTHYFEINNLSMGGANLISHKGIVMPNEPGQTLEVLMFGGEISLKCVARLIASTFVEKLCVQAGIEIVGIDESSRKILGDFLRKIEATAPKPPNTIPPSG